MNDLIIPARYLAPKWQAYVTPKDTYFVFKDGTTIGSLWGLKQSLLVLPEDVILHHIRPDGNDIANWIKSVIGDEILASEIEKYKHRWGLVVSLERHMMRTLNLPHYLANRWLRETTHAFTFETGEQVNSLLGLRETLQKVSDETVEFHQERTPNDISVWVSDIIGDYELGELIDEASSRVQMHRFVSDHVEMLEEASQEC